MIECKIVDPDVDGFPDLSGDLFAVLIYYFEMGDAGMKAVDRFAVDVNCTGYLIVMLFHSIPLTI